ncbi:hypothetical protein [Nucisporomicrobium flavum]|uniref:hypothetical protein n=1 Tax=Nucisporomicrobium flavum TaxID=2785915 RepID=UPI0018F6C7BB|nr:hypothetical protein [Nucisporomicrobium flavum]
MTIRPDAEHADSASPALAMPPNVTTPPPQVTGEGPGGTDDGQPDEPPDAGEVERLRAEVSALQERLETRRRRTSLLGTLRRVLAAALIALAAFALVASVVGVWSARTAMNTDRWVATVAPLPQDPRVAAAVADYATNQIFVAVDVEQRLRTVLPEQAAFIAGPVTGQLRGTVRDTVTKVLQSDQFQRIWVEVTRRAHERAVAVLNGTSDLLVVREDRVDIDLLPLINQVLRQLSAQLPTMFGKQLALPDLSSGAIPDNLRDRVQQTLGVTLPPNFAQFAVYDSGRLWAAQQAVAQAKRGLILTVAATVLLLLVALAVSPARRRTLLQLGLWLVVAAVAVTAVLRAIRAQVLEQVPAGLYRDGADAALTTVFAQLRTRGLQIIWIGALLAVLMYLIGPGRGPRWLRRHLADGARAAGRGIRAGARAAVARGPGWVAAYLDVLRVGGLVVAAGFALILSSWTALLVIALVLAAYEVAVTLAARGAAYRAERDAAPPAAGLGAS